MCGIIGYTGSLDAVDLLLNGLEGLEYRGYDSAGIAYFNGENQIRLVKKTGRVAALRECIGTSGHESRCGVGHTRWATHGYVTDKNAHPHRAGRVTLIHNGIIENHRRLTEEYRLSHSLVSQTDSEVAAWVLDAVYEECGRDPLASIGKFVEKLHGTYGFCILFDDYPGEIYAVRSVSPLVAAMTESGAMAASDLTALLPYTRQYFVVPQDHIVRLTPHSVSVYNRDCHRIQPEMLEAGWDRDAAMKNGFPHFMLKEIHEQPDALRNTILPRLVDHVPDFRTDGIPDGLFTGCSQIRIIGCGTAMHAGMVAKSLMEPFLGIPVIVSIASEFRYEAPLIDEKTLVIVISQSGETIDTLAAMGLSRSLKAPVLAIVNVEGSTIARESDYVLYTHAGPEIAVASTKAYSVQLAALYMVCCRMALSRKQISHGQAQEFTRGLLSAIPAMEAMISRSGQIKALVSHLLHQQDTFFIGRGVDYAYSLEGALKLKEISYIHAEAYAAGELKHGTIALIYDNIPVIAIATQDHVFAKTLSNVREIKARGAFVILIVKELADVDQGAADVVLRIPDMKGPFTAFPVAAVVQLIAYHVSAARNLDVDRPRNLAKSVTVE